MSTKLSSLLLNKMIFNYQYSFEIVLFAEEVPKNYQQVKTNIMSPHSTRLKVIKKDTKFSIQLHCLDSRMI